MTHSLEKLKNFFLFVKNREICQFQIFLIETSCVKIKSLKLIPLNRRLQPLNFEMKSREFEHIVITKFLNI